MTVQKLNRSALIKKHNEKLGYAIYWKQGAAVKCVRRETMCEFTGAHLFENNEDQLIANLPEGPAGIASDKMIISSRADYVDYMKSANCTGSFFYDMSAALDFIKQKIVDPELKSILLQTF